MRYAIAKRVDNTPLLSALITLPEPEYISYSIIPGEHQFDVVKVKVTEIVEKIADMSSVYFSQEPNPDYGSVGLYNPIQDLSTDTTSVKEYACDVFHKIYRDLVRINYNVVIHGFIAHVSSDGSRYRFSTLFEPAGKDLNNIDQLIRKHIIDTFLSENS